MTFLEAAIEVLRREGKPLHYKELTRLAIKFDLLSVVGRDPEEAMQTRLQSEVKRTTSDLVRVSPGIFGLRPGATAPVPAGGEPRPSEPGSDLPPAEKPASRAAARPPGEAAPRERGARSARGRRTEAAPAVAADAAAPVPGAEVHPPAPGRAQRGRREDGEPRARLSGEDRRRDRGGKGRPSHEAAPSADAAPREPMKLPIDVPAQSAAPGAPVETAPPPRVVPSEAPVRSPAPVEPPNEAAPPPPASITKAGEGAGAVTASTSPNPPRPDAVGSPAAGVPVAVTLPPAPLAAAAAAVAMPGSVVASTVSVLGSVAAAVLSPPPPVLGTPPVAAPPVVPSAHTPRPSQPASASTPTAASPPSSSAPAARPGESGPRLMSLADAIYDVLRGSSDGRPLSVRQIAEIAIKRRLVRGDLADVTRAMRTTLVREQRHRDAEGLRPRIRNLGQGQCALGERKLEPDLYSAERDLVDRISRTREATRVALRRRLRTLPPAPFEILVRLLLERMGMVSPEIIKRAEGVVYFGGSLTRGARAIKVLVAVRGGEAEIPREAIGELRAGVRLRGYDEGLLLSSARLSSAAQTEASALPGIEVYDQEALTDLLIRLHLGVRRMQVPVDYLDTDLFAELLDPA